MDGRAAVGPRARLFQLRTRAEAVDEAVHPKPVTFPGKPFLGPVKPPVGPPKPAENKKNP